MRVSGGILMVEEKRREEGSQSIAVFFRAVS